MKNRLLLYYLILFSCTIFAQTDYVKYHQEARFIESKILDSSYTEAIEQYKHMLSTYDFVFAEDCFRAAQTAAFVNDTANAFSFLERAALQGVTQQRIVSDSLLSGLRKSEYWSTFEQVYSTNRNNYLSGINWELRQKINELYELDQKYRDKHELHLWNFLWRPFIWMKWKKITAEIVENELIPLIQTYGFPGERLIGVDDARFHHKHKWDQIKSNFAFMILIHYFSVPRCADFNELLLSQIKTGNIHPRQYASLIDFQATNGKNKFYKGLHYNEWGGSKDASEFEQINQNRFNIGLESIETRSKIFQRAFNVGKQINKGSYRHIKFWVFNG